MTKDEFTFEGFEPANTTAVPDVLFDVLLPHLSEVELKVLLYIIRRTSGFKKSEDAISFSQFQEGIRKRSTGEYLDHGCGIKNRTVLSKALAHLEQMGCIQSHKSDDPQGDKATTVYRICFQGEGVVSKTYQGSNENVPPQYPNDTTGSNQSVPGVVSKTYPQLNSNTRYSSQETVRQEGNVTFANAESDAPANLYHFEEEKKRITEGRIPAIKKEQQAHDSSSTHSDNLAHSSIRVDGSDEQSSSETAATTKGRVQPTAKNATRNNGRKAKPTYELTPEQAQFWQLWCAVWFNAEIPPTMNDLAYSHVQKLAKVKYTAESLNEHIEFARKYLADTQGIKRKNVMLGNLVQTYAAWRQSQQPRENTSSTPTFTIDEDRNKRNLEAMRARVAEKRARAANG